ncbi:MAG: phosphoglycerate dehydrogenase [Oscillospiraceae bacterium]|nr:phosphoglycerate dehydrogenase [Oscillospiraceae bacterium]
MYNVKLMNKISSNGLNRLPSDLFTCGADVQNPAALLVRSADLHSEEFNPELLCIARAGAGVNNIPLDRAAEAGVVVFNTPGANANAVKELVLTGLFLSSRKVAEGIEWAKTLKESGDEVGKLVEKGKGQFVGPEIAGKTLGVIGLGAIGVLVANAAERLGMTVLGYDPYLSVDAAWSVSRNIRHCTDINEIYEKSDYITIHVPATPETAGMINAATISVMKDDVRILNFARGTLVNTDDILKALYDGKVAKYVTDFPDAKLIDVPNVIALPHLGASTPESEENCAVMAVDELKNYILRGNIKNSVNFPTVCMPMNGVCRLCVLHKNVPNTVNNITWEISALGLNIANMQNASKRDWAYTVIDLDNDADEAIIEKISALPAVVRARLIRK